MRHPLQCQDASVPLTSPATPDLDAAGPSARVDGNIHLSLIHFVRTVLDDTNDEELDVAYSKVTKRDLLFLCQKMSLDTDTFAARSKQVLFEQILNQVSPSYPRPCCED